MPCVPLSSALHCFVGFLPLLDLSAAPHHESPSSSCFVGLCAQIMMSLKTTASKYAKLSALPHAKPLSKAMIKKGGPEATAAIISIFGSSPHFKALVTAEMAEDMSEYVQTNGLRAAAVGVAYKMTQNFLLAAPDPGEKEVLISLKATLDDLAR